MVFFICAGVYLAAFIFYAIFASGEEQDWAKDAETKEERDIPLKMDEDRNRNVKL